MKKCAAGLAVVLCMGMLSGCGASYSADESTIFVEKNGKIAATDVESFDEDIYGKDDLSDYVKDAISEYTSENGKDTVKLKDLSVKDEKAVLTIEYKNAKAYSDFNGVELFSGSVSEALAAGYRFDEDFVSVKDGKAVKSVDSSEFVKEDGLKVVIVKANTDVSVKGTIQYVTSKNVSLTGKNTVSIRDGLSALLEESSTEQEPGEQTQVAEEIQNTEAIGSVDEDEMLTGTEEESSMTFEFKDGEEPQTNSSEFTSIYTYIIYK